MTHGQTTKENATPDMKRMIARKYYLLFIIAFAVLGPQLFLSCKLKRGTINNIAFGTRKNAILEQYPKVPKEAILLQMNNGMLYGELKERFRKTLTHLKAETDNDCAKLMVVIVSPDVGKNINVANSYGIPFEVEVCNEMGIDVVDLSPDIAAKEPSDITMVPYDGNWSKDGAIYISKLLSEYVVDKFATYYSSKKFRNETVPETFGDLPAKYNEVLQDEKNISYHVKANKQGLRMNYDLTFPKTKQRFLFLGGAAVFQPYMDNEFTSTALLQKQYPDKEMINAGRVGDNLDDVETLYVEKARYVQPDVVVVFTDGMDILDFYFSARNQNSRSKQIYLPSENELRFYQDLYGKSADQ